MKKFILLCLGLLILPSLSFAQSDSYLEEQVNQLKSDLVILQRQIYHDKNDTTAPAESVTNFQIKLGEYEENLRNLNGKIEDIEHRIKTLEKKIETFDTDIDLRFLQMQKHNGGPSATSTVSKKTSAPQGVAPKTLYEQALNDLKNNKLSNAESKLTQFLASYPKDTLAGNAQYWLGEVYYKQQNFAKAAVAFKDGYSNYPNGAKGPDCLLKLGLSMKSLGKNEEACTAFVNLPTMFSNVSADISKRAKKEAESLACK